MTVFSKKKYCGKKRIKNLIITIIFFIFSSFHVSSQNNLIPNPGFEEYYTCDYNWGGTPIQNIMPGWSKILYSPFYANHTCYLDPTSEISNESYLAPALFGNAFMIMVFRENAAVSFLPLRTYLQCRLLDTLSPDKDYYVSYYVSNPRIDSSPTVSHWGLHFSDEYVVEQNTGIQFGLLKRNPQIEIDTIPKLTFGVWTKYEHCFRPDSLFTVMTVGHFRENDETLGVGDLIHSRALISYDNFFLAEIEQEVTLVTSKDTLCVGECITLSSNHSLIPGSFYWEAPGSDIGDSRDSVITVCYSQPGTYDIYLTVEHCTGRYEGVFHKAITVLPTIQYQKPENMLICYGDSIEVDIQTVHNWYWEDGTDKSRILFRPGVYVFTVDNGFCVETDSIVLDYQTLPSAVKEIVYTCPESVINKHGREYSQPGYYEWTLMSVEGCDSVWYGLDYRHHALQPLKVEGSFGFCEGDSTRLVVVSDHESLVWHDGMTQKERTVWIPGIYSLTGRDIHQCSVSFTMEIESYKHPEVLTRDLLDIWYEKGVQLPVEYEGTIIRYIWNGGESLDCNQCPYPSLIRPVEGIYNITIVDENGCADTSSIRVTFAESEIRYPNIVRKNAQSNGIFYLTADLDLGYELSVYDRWGSMIYHQPMAITNDEQTGWTPSAGLESGVYVFIVQYEERGQIKYIYGDITLLE